MLVDALSVALRALSFVALFQAAGAAMFLALFGRQLGGTVLTVRRLGSAFAWAGVALVLAHHALEAGRIGGGFASIVDPALQAMMLHLPAGVALAWRLMGLLLVGVGLRMAAPRGTTFALVGAVLAIAAFTQLGHTAAHDERWALSTLLLIHLLTVAFWFGALLPLTLVSRREPPAVAAEAVRHFSALALWLVPLLFLAGLVLAIVLLPNVGALKLPYGRLLLLKIVGFALLMLLAALNKWRLGPALAAGGERAGAALRRSVRTEYALVTLILTLTATLTTFYSPDG